MHQLNSLGKGSPFFVQNKDDIKLRDANFLQVPSHISCLDRRKISSQSKESKSFVNLNRLLVKVAVELSRELSSRTE